MKTTLTYSILDAITWIAAAKDGGYITEAEGKEAVALAGRVMLGRAPKEDKKRLGALMAKVLGQKPYGVQRV